MNSSIFNRLNEDYNYIKTLYDENNVLGLFIFNDITEVIVIPTFEEVCLNNPNINNSILYNNHLILIKDIRLTYMASALGHTEMIEGLYTDDYIVNPKYEHLYLKLLRRNRDNIKKCAIAGMPSEELKTALMKIMRTSMNECSSAVKFIKQISDIEKLALEEIIKIIGDEGTFSQYKIASSTGISKVTISNLINKMEQCGVATVRSLGQKGTYIKIIDDTLLNIRGE